VITGANNGKDGKCSLSCTLVGPNTPISCGNGIFDLGETCVNCSQDLSDICITQCGNGIKELSEQCDNGANNGKDGKCSLTCTLVGPNTPISCGNGIFDLGETCVNCSQDLSDICITQCGNGIKELSEQCDNGANNGKDGNVHLAVLLLVLIRQLVVGMGYLIWERPVLIVLKILVIFVLPNVVTG
jgi:cysteine-rich repeat protein